MSDFDCGETDSTWEGRPEHLGVFERFTRLSVAACFALALVVLVVVCWGLWPEIQADRLDGMSRLHEARATATALGRE